MAWDVPLLIRRRGKPDAGEGPGGDSDARKLHLHSRRASRHALCDKACREELVRLYHERSDGHDGSNKNSIRLLGWWNEIASTLTDEQVSDSRRKQKVLTGPITIMGYSLFAVKMMAGERLAVSYEQLRHLMERAIEVVMDTKKAPTHSDGTVWDPMLIHRAISGNDTRVAPEKLVAYLEEQGFETRLRWPSSGGPSRSSSTKRPPGPYPGDWSGSRMSLTSRGETKKAHAARARSGWVELRGKKHFCLFHRNWGQLLEAMAGSEAFTFEVQSIIREPNAKKASEMTKLLAQRILRRLLKVGAPIETSNLPVNG